MQKSLIDNRNTLLSMGDFAFKSIFYNIELSTQHPVIYKANST